MKYWEVVEEKVQTSDPELDGCVAEINRVGYLYLFNESQERVIVPAQVKLYSSDPVSSTKSTDGNGEAEVQDSSEEDQNVSD